LNNRRLSEPLWVLDTNVVLDLLHFDDPAARPLLNALNSGRVRCAATAATFGEWQRVLAYPAFGLSAARQIDLRERYRAVCAFSEPPVAAGVPRCADADDQKFLDLAAALRAPLVSKDRKVLKLRRRCAPQFPVLTLAEAVRWLARG
jgi:predicted nucleic acid-binding protein